VYRYLTTLTLTLSLGLSSVAVATPPAEGAETPKSAEAKGADAKDDTKAPWDVEQ
jgi:hypothetical protein